MAWAPISETRQIGRNPLCIGALVVSVFLRFAVIYAQNFGVLVAFRFLTGFFWTTRLGIGRASIGNLFDSPAPTSLSCSSFSPKLAFANFLHRLSRRPQKAYREQKAKMQAGDRKQGFDGRTRPSDDARLLFLARMIRFHRLAHDSLHCTVQYSHRRPHRHPTLLLRPA